MLLSMEYSQLYHPLTRTKYNIHSAIGRGILKQYVKTILSQHGGSGNSRSGCKYHSNRSSPLYDTCSPEGNQRSDLCGKDSKGNCVKKVCRVDARTGRCSRKGTGSASDCVEDSKTKRCRKISTTKQTKTPLSGSDIDRLTESLFENDEEDSDSEAEVEGEEGKGVSGSTQEDVGSPKQQACRYHSNKSDPLYDTCSPGGNKRSLICGKSVNGECEKKVCRVDTSTGKCSRIGEGDSEPCYEHPDTKRCRKKNTQSLAPIPITTPDIDSITENLFHTDSESDSDDESNSVPIVETPMPVASTSTACRYYSNPKHSLYDTCGPDGNQRSLKCGKNAEGECEKQVCRVNENTGKCARVGTGSTEPCMEHPKTKRCRKKESPRGNPTPPRVIGKRAAATSNFGMVPVFDREIEDSSTPPEFSSPSDVARDWKSSDEENEDDENSITRPTNPPSSRSRRIIGKRAAATSNLGMVPIFEQEFDDQRTPPVFDAPPSPTDSEIADIENLMDMDAPLHDSESESESEDETL